MLRPSCVGSRRALPLHEHAGHLLAQERGVLFLHPLGPGPLPGDRARLSCMHTAGMRSVRRVRSFSEDCNIRGEVETFSRRHACQDEGAAMPPSRGES